MQRRGLASAGSWLGAAAVMGCLALGSTRAEARQIKCESPSHGYCLAHDTVNLVTCVCGGETTEVDRDLQGTSEAELGEICWEVWGDVCAAWNEPAECEDPGLGRCEVDGRDGGTADCTCEDGRSVERDDVPSVGGFSGEALEEGCFEALEELCAPPPPPTPAAAPPAPFVEPEPRAEGCRIAGSGAPLGGLGALLLFALGAGGRCRSLSAGGR